VEQSVMPLSTDVASMKGIIFDQVLVTQAVNAQLIILYYLVLLFIRKLLERITF
jgi:hypothetical protein